MVDSRKDNEFNMKGKCDELKVTENVEADPMINSDQPQPDNLPFWSSFDIFHKKKHLMISLIENY